MGANDHQDPCAGRWTRAADRAAPFRGPGQRLPAGRAAAAGRACGQHLPRRQGSDILRGQIAAQGATANIPARRNRKKVFAFSRELHRARNLIERLFGKLKHARGLATRYDKRADTYLAAIKNFAARIWIKAYEPTAKATLRAPRERPISAGACAAPLRGERERREQRTAGRSKAL